MDSSKLNLAFPINAYQHDKFILKDNVWGEITLPWQFNVLLDLPEIIALRFKRQLSMSYRNPCLTGAEGKRYSHVLGTVHVGQLFISGNANLFSYKAEMAFLTCLLYHDAGHGAGSHAFEGASKNTHEEETLRLLRKRKHLFDFLFGDDVGNLVIMIFTQKINVKKKNLAIREDELEFLILFSKFVASGLDLDRIDYLTRDCLYVNGNHHDFTKIFSHMHMELIDDHVEVAYDVCVMELVQEFFMLRFNNYKYIYFKAETLLLDDYFRRFMLECIPKSKLKSQTTEAYVDYLIECKKCSNPIQSHLQKVLHFGHSPDIYWRKFNDKSDYRIFHTLLSKIIELDDFFSSTIYRKVVIYDSDKNKVFIKDGSKVMDFIQAQKVIADKVQYDIWVVYVDVFLLEYFLRNAGKTEEEIADLVKSIQTLFTETLVETEKKFMVNGITIDSLKNYFDNLGNHCTITKKGLKTNNDTYAIGIGFDPQYGSVRIRNVDGSIEGTIKFATKDASSVSKRDELPVLRFGSMNDFLSHAESILRERGYNTDLVNNHTILHLVVERYFYKIVYCDPITKEIATFEVAIDSMPYKGTSKVMLEIEQKTGQTICLHHFVNEMFKAFDRKYLVPCNLSKLMIIYDIEKMLSKQAS